MRLIRVTETAWRDIETIYAWLSADNPAAAERIVTRIVAAIRGLAEFAIGRPGRVPKTFEKLVTGLPYFVVYSIEEAQSGEEIVILTIHHTSRNYPR